MILYITQTFSFFSSRSQSMPGTDQIMTLPDCNPSMSAHIRMARVVPDMQLNLNFSICLLHLATRSLENTADMTLHVTALTTSMSSSGNPVPLHYNI